MATIAGVKSEGEEAAGQVIMIPTDQLITSPKNPRALTEEGYAGLLNSIRKDPEFLTKRPVLVSKVNGMYVIYGGAQRFKACKELKFAEVPCIVSEGLSHDVIDYRMLADNAHAGEWDKEKLTAEFAEEMEEMKYGFGNMGTVIVEEEKKGDKVITKKLTFNNEADMQKFYDILEKLSDKYPEYTVSRRITEFLSDYL